MAPIDGVIFDLGSTLIRFRGEWPEVLGRGREAAAAWLSGCGYELDSASFSEDLHTAFQQNFRVKRAGRPYPESMTSWIRWRGWESASDCCRTPATSRTSSA
jgi:FMN phosphatase YigB (HAD superfamily)